MKDLILNNGFIAVVDDCDYEKVVVAGPWRTKKRYRKDGSLGIIYVQRNSQRKGKQTQQLLHRFILGLFDPRIKVDHEDHDGLNNSRKNIRVCTQSQNSCNRRKIKAVRTSSRFKGVSWYKPYSKWRVQIEIGGRKKHLGYFTDELAAAAIYDAKAKEIFQDFALLNRRGVTDAR